MPRGRPRKKYPSLEELPDSLRLAIAKIMVQFKMSDLERVYDYAAILIDSNSEEYEKQVNNEAEQRYRSRHFKEMNKARTTIESRVRDWTSKTSYQKAKNEYHIWGFCSQCGEQYSILPNSDAHKEVIDHLLRNNWKHTECPKKQ